MDGSRIDRREAGRTRSEGRYLGMVTTVSDAEELGVAMAWERCDMVALDSQGVIRHISNLMSQEPRSWIEDKLVRQMAEASDPAVGQGPCERHGE